MESTARNPWGRYRRGEAALTVDWAPYICDAPTANGRCRMHLSEAYSRCRVHSRSGRSGRRSRPRSPPIVDPDDNPFDDDMFIEPRALTPPLPQHSPSAEMEEKRRLLKDTEAQLERTVAEGDAARVRRAGASVTGAQAAWFEARRRAIDTAPAENTWNTDDAAEMELRSKYKAICGRKIALESQISELKKSLTRGSFRDSVQHRGRVRDALTRRTSSVWTGGRHDASLY